MSSSEELYLTWKECGYEKDKSPTVRNSHSTTSDDKHKTLYIFGGRSKGGCNNHLYELSLSNISKGWNYINTTGDIPEPRKSCGFIYLNGFLYLFGGNTKGNQLKNDLYTFEISKKKWLNILKPKNNILPCERDRHSMVVINGKIFLFGGHSSKNEFLNDLWYYNPLNNTWNEIKCNKKLPYPRYEHICVCIGQHYLLVSGGKYANGGLNDYWVLDTNKISKWEEHIKECITNNINEDESQRVSWEQIKVISQQTNNDKNNNNNNNNDDDNKIDDNDNNNDIENRKLEARWGQSCVVFHDKLIFFGGWNGKFCFNDVFVLLASKTPFKLLKIHIKGNRPSIRTFHGCGILGNKMMICSGRNNTKRLNDTYMLDISDLLPDEYKNKRTKESRKSISDVTQDNINNDLAQKTKLNNYQKPQSGLYLDKKKGKKVNMDQFILKNTLGTGSFGRVRLVIYIPSKEYFAMKMLRKSRVVEMKQENHIKWEYKILSSIRHPFIVNLESTFQDKYFIYFVLELVQGGEFFTLLKKAGKLQMAHCAFYASQIVLVFQFLHRNKIVYRDLKPENLLISSDGYLRLTDFGFAKRLESPYRTWTLCGTPEYIAPEILLNRGHSFSVDWWALGILIYEMFWGHPPFVDDNPMKIYQKILDGNIQWPKDPKNKTHIIPKRGRDFISGLLTQKPNQRLGNLENGAIDVMKHPFFHGVNWKKILDKRISKVPWCPKISAPDDVNNFDPYDENSDTENTALDDDPFLNDF